MRLLLFTEVPGTRNLAIRLRQPQNFAERWDPDYWKLAVTLRGFERQKPIPGFDPFLGWLGDDVARGSYAHRLEPAVGERRPILLYGDSFAHCATAREQCWEGLLQDSELGTDHALLNYGVGGFGLDQIHLMLRASIDRFTEQDPTVIVGILVEDDLDRSLLPFRGWAKPRLWVEDGTLTAPERLTGGTEAWLEENPPEVTSYAWRYLVHGTSLLPRGFRESKGEERERIAELRELTGALLASTRDELRARGIPWFVVIFHGPKVFQPPRGAQMREDILVGLLREHGIPYVSSRTYLRDHAEANGTFARDYFLENNHLNPLGNQVVFQAFLDGLAGRFED